MKIGLSLFISLFAFIFFQHGCSDAEKSNQLSPASNQNSNSTLVNSTPPSPNETPLVNQKRATDEATFEELRPIFEHTERCKHAPIGKAEATPLTGTAPLKVYFDDGGSYDPDGNKIVEWKWHFGNGESKKGKAVAYTYEKPGEYGIFLDVTDSQGQKTSGCSDMGTGILITVTDEN